MLAKDQIGQAKDKELGAREAEVTAKSKVIKTMEEELLAKDQIVQAKEKELDAREAEVTAKSKVIETNQGRIHLLSGDLEVMREQVEQIQVVILFRSLS